MFIKILEYLKSYSITNWVFLLLHILAFLTAGLTFHPLINPLYISILCLISLIPLAGTISDVTDWIIVRTSPIFAALLNAGFGNFPELIFGLFSVANGEYEFLLAVCFGSVLSNTLLAMGLTIMVGHMKNPSSSIEKYHLVHRSGAKALFVATCAYFISYTHFMANETPSKELDIILSVMLITVYIYNTFFTISIVRKIENKGKNLIDKTINWSEYLSPMANFGSRVRHFKNSKPKDVALHIIEEAKVIGSDLSQVVVDLAEQEADELFEDIQEVKTNLSSFEFIKKGLVWVAIIGVLLYATIISALITNGMTEQITDLSIEWGLSARFIGGVLVAIVSNACEHWSAIVAAKKGDIDAGLQISLSSSLQILMFLIPLFVIGSTQREKFLFIGTDPILIIPVFLTSIVIPLTLSSSVLDMYSGVGLIALFAMFSVLFYVN